MMRFQYEKPASPVRNVILSLTVFAVISGSFFFGVSTLSLNTGIKQEEALQNAVQNAITHCYAAEGFYPETLDYLIENYGVSYDSDKYFVSYQIMGSNLMPKVTITANRTR